MRKSIAWAVVCSIVMIGLYACGGGGGSSSGGSTNADVNGYWSASFTQQGASTASTEYFQFTQAGSTVTLNDSCQSGQPLSGTISGNNLSFGATLTGTVNGNTITGSYSGNTTGTWTATKLSAAPTGKQCIVSTVEAFCVYFPNSTQYYVESDFSDPSALVASATITGSNIVSAVSYSYNLYPSNPDEWWTNPNIYISTGTPPTFPLNYSINIIFKDGTSQLVSQAVTTWELAQ